MSYPVRLVFAALLALALLLPATQSDNARAASGTAAYATKLTVIYCFAAPCPGPWTSLMAVDPSATGEDAELGKIETASGDTPVISSLALSASDILYGSDGHTLYTIDRGRSCCRATAIGPVGEGKNTVNALAFTPDGRLLASTATAVLQISPSTGATLARYDLGAHLAGSLVAARQTNQLYASTNPFGPPCERVLQVCAAVVPPHDGLARITLGGTSSARAATVRPDVGLTGLVGLFYTGTTLSGIAYRQQQILKGCESGSMLISIDVTTGQTSNIRCLSFIAVTATGKPAPVVPAIASVRVAHGTIRPGQKQTISVRTVPRAGILVTSIEPGGRVHRITGTVAQNGLFRTTWRVSRSRGSAQVTVSARQGAVNATKRVSFAIR